ncbi:MAG: DUF5688 family protein [Ruminococcus sp.]|nr:DUF5688 family protein [Ruminococcus sp.]MCM1154409.1 DUF5688 family protein [Roseburia sp.]
MVLEQFGHRVCKALQEILGADYDVEMKEVTKNNGVLLHGIVINKAGSNVSPAIYIDELYDEYGEGRSFGDIVYDLLRVYKHHAREIDMDMDFFTRFEKARSRVLYKLIHRESNAELLKEIPYIKWNDLALVFYYSLEDERFGKASILIKNAHLAMWGIDKAVLYEHAGTNMLRLKPEELLPIKELLREFIDRSESCTPGKILLSDRGRAAMETDSMIYVLSSRDRLFGAATILYTESLKLLAGRLDKNLIILPSSVHEVLLVPDDGIREKDFFRNMVREVNDSQVEPEERLSYNVYYYDRFSGEISIL